MRRLAVTAGIAAATGLLITTIFSAGVSPASAQTPPVVSIDMDTSGTPCSPVDATRNATSSDPNFTVAVCVSNLAEPPAAIEWRVLYDDTIIDAPEVADAGTGLDDNPDANVGATTFGATNLGTGWDCSGSGLNYPTGDQNPATGPGNGRAFSGGCSSVAGPYALGTSGVLAEITFDILAGGTSTLVLNQVVITGESGLEAASCAPAISVTATCNNGSIDVSGQSAPTATPTATATAIPPTATPCSGACPTFTPTEGPAPKTPTPTPTNTVAAGETPGAGTTPPGGGGTTPPGGGAGAGSGTPRTGVTLPDTGSGSGSGGGSNWPMGALALASAVALAAGIGLRLRSRRSKA